MASCFSPPVVLANPTGASVANGQVSFHQQGNLLQITNSPNAIINWQSFSIGANEIARFVQQSASSAVLNRVIGQNPSAILGALQSNGRVFLINANGIVFGANAQIDVAGLVASSLNLSDADFLGGRLKFTETVGAGAVVNAGAITTPSGGQVYLVGASVENKGLIKSPQGEVVLAAGKSVELVDAGTPNLRVEVVAPDSRAVNLGEIATEAGRAGIYAGLITQGGTIQANSAQVTEDGRIVLKATHGATLEAGSVTTANSRTGGTVTVESGDTTLVAGTIEAKGGEGEGGTVAVLGNKVGLIGSADIDVSGETGGGRVLMGGDFQGKNSDIQNAYRTYVGPDTTTRADAVANGDGGKVIVWSDDATRAYGTISATGGAEAGNGGFVEVSSKNALDFAAKVNASAPNGTAGTLLLDPANINVATTASGAALSDVDAFAVNSGTLQTIDPSTLNAGATVVLQATNSINVANAVNLTSPSVGFVAQAGNNITVNATITTNGGDIHLEADSPHSPTGGGDGSGQVQIVAAISTRGTSGLVTDGSVTLIGGGNRNSGVNAGGIELGNQDVLAGTGGIRISLSAAGTLDLGVGAPGATQLSSDDIAKLKTTGPLVIGEATTAGSDGRGLNAQTLTVKSITNSTATAIQLSPESGTSFELIAGADGVTLQRPITAFQDVVIKTTGSVDLDDTIDTTAGDSNVTITATGGLVLGPSGSINVGSGVCSLNGQPCSGSSPGGPVGPPPGGPDELPPEVERPSVSPQNILVSSTDQAVTPPVAISSGTEDEDTKEKKSETAKKPICSGSGRSQAAVAAGVGAGGRRCTSRGCF